MTPEPKKPIVLFVRSSNVQHIPRPGTGSTEKPGYRFKKPPALTDRHPSRTAQSTIVTHFPLWKEQVLFCLDSMMTHPWMRCVLRVLLTIAFDFQNRTVYAMNWITAPRPTAVWRSTHPTLHTIAIPKLDN